MSENIFAEGFRTEPYWWDAVPRDAGAGLPAEALPDSADVVVVRARRPDRGHERLYDLSLIHI